MNSTVPISPLMEGFKKGLAMLSANAPVANAEQPNPQRLPLLDLSMCDQLDTRVRKRRKRIT